MFKVIIAIVFFIIIANDNGISTYKNVETLSDLGSLMNVYLSSMTAVILLAFGLDDIYRN